MTIAMLKTKQYIGADLSPEFKKLYARDKKLITEQLLKLGCTQIIMSRQFYYYYGFFTAPNKTIFYFNTHDVRFFGTRGEDRMLYRAVFDYADGVGGKNLYVSKFELASMLLTARPDEGRYPKVVQADYPGGGTAVTTDSVEYK